MNSIWFIYLFNDMTRQPCNMVKIKHCSGKTAYRKINLQFQCPVSLNSTVSWFLSIKLRNHNSYRLLKEEVISL